jgi:nucleotide-binding universal stress UspA family protein
LEEGETITGLNLHARYADLVIAGQVDPRDPEWADLRLPERVVLESGRPVMVIPFIGAPQPIGKRIMVAWNASREAVRAVNDALPLLVDADTVEVLAINPPVGEAGDGDIPCADICLHLARHGINAIAESMQAEDIQVGDLLLSRAVDRGVDLIVMGAYGHSRFREIVLSGVSRRLFKHMTTPVLFSH